MLKHLFLRIQLRIEQELMLIRYAFLHKIGGFSKCLIVARPLFFLFSVGFLFSVFFNLKHTSNLTHQVVNVSLLIIYVGVLANTLFQKGYGYKRFKKMKVGIFVLIALQCTSLFSFSISSIQDKGDKHTFQQTNNVIERVLPGGMIDREFTGLSIHRLSVEDGVELNVQDSDVIVEEDEVAPLEEELFVELAIKGEPLNYPNPCRLGKEGTTIGYYLTKPANMELRVYDTGFMEIYRQEFLLGENGGRGSTIDTPTSYNRIAITAAELGTSDVPAGIYYYVLLSDGKILGKGKIAALP